MAITINDVNNEAQKSAMRNGKLLELSDFDKIDKAIDSERQKIVSLLEEFNAKLPEGSDLAINPDFYWDNLYADLATGIADGTIDANSIISTNVLDKIGTEFVHNTIKQNTFDVNFQKAVMIGTQTIVIGSLMAMSQEEIKGTRYFRDNPINLMGKLVDAMPVPVPEKEQMSALRSIISITNGFYQSVPFDQYEPPKAQELHDVEKPKENAGMNIVQIMQKDNQNIEKKENIKKDLDKAGSILSRGPFGRLANYFGQKIQRYRDDKFEGRPVLDRLMRFFGSFGDDITQAALKSSAGRYITTGSTEKPKALPQGEQQKEVQPEQAQTIQNEPVLQNNYQNPTISKIDQVMESTQVANPETQYSNAELENIQAQLALLEAEEQIILGTQSAPVQNVQPQVELPNTLEQYKVDIQPQQPSQEQISQPVQTVEIGENGTVEQQPVQEQDKQGEER